MQIVPRFIVGDKIDPNHRGLTLSEISKEAKEGTDGGPLAAQRTQGFQGLEDDADVQMKWHDPKSKT